MQRSGLSGPGDIERKARRDRSVQAQAAGITTRPLDLDIGVVANQRDVPGLTTLFAARKLSQERRIDHPDPSTARPRGVFFHVATPEKFVAATGIDQHRVDLGRAVMQKDAAHLCRDQPPHTRPRS